MSHIQKMSAHIVMFLNILIVFVPLFLVLKWMSLAPHIENQFLSPLLGFLEETMRIQTPTGLVHLGSVTWTTYTELLGFFAYIIGFFPFFISLFFLKRIFENYKNGDIFVRKNTILYRNLGILYFIDALLIQIVSETLMILAVTISNPPGSRYISISFGTPNLSALFYGTLIIIISWVMLEASRLHDEHQFTI